MYEIGYLRVDETMDICRKHKNGIQKREKMPKMSVFSMKTGRKNLKVSNKIPVFNENGISKTKTGLKTGNEGGPK